MTRLPRVRAEAEVYNIISYDVRARDYTVATGGIDNAVTTLPINDASPLLVGDVLEIGTERMEVTGGIVLTTTPNTVTVRRAREGTTAAAATATTAIKLIGNSRTGSEIDQEASRAVRTAVQQVVQTFQFPVQVGGKAQAVMNIRMPAGIPDVFTMEQKTKLVEFMRDEEYSSYYGVGEVPVADGDRGKQRGLKSLIGGYRSGANVKTASSSNYTKLSFIADTFQKALDGGGNPDLILASTDMMTGLATWSVGLQQFNMPRMTSLGIPIKEFEVPFLGQPATFVPSYQLKKGTVVALTTSDVRVRYLREESWKGRGSRGDAYEGDWLSDVCIEVNHPGWHAWVENIQTYA
jgi:hypothetical protein